MTIGIKTESESGIIATIVIIIGKKGQLLCIEIICKIKRVIPVMCDIRKFCKFVGMLTSILPIKLVIKPTNIVFIRSNESGGITGEGSAYGDRYIVQQMDIKLVITPRIVPEIFNL